jgi:hypothetical protein
LTPTCQGILSDYGADVKTVEEALKNEKVHAYIQAGLDAANTRATSNVK